MVVQLSGTWQAAQSILKPSPCGDCACDADSEQAQSAIIIHDRASRKRPGAERTAFFHTREMRRSDGGSNAEVGGQARYIVPVYAKVDRTVDDESQFRMKTGEIPTKRADSSWIGYQDGSVRYPAASHCHYLWQSLHSCLGNLNEGTLRAGSGSGLWHFLQSTLACLPSSG